MQCCLQLGFAATSLYLAPFGSTADAELLAQLRLGLGHVGSLNVVSGVSAVRLLPRCHPSNQVWVLNRRCRVRFEGGTEHRRRLAYR